MKTIAIANQKGGTGKTTTAYNLGIALTQQGYRVLMVDFDPQGNLSCYCGIPPEQDLEQTITELLMKVAYEKPLSHRECVYQSKRTDDSAPQVDFIPSNLRLASFELAMGTMMCREVLLKTCLEQYSSQYDYCIIDCSPSVGLLLTNALSAANEVIIPMQAQPFSVVGMSQLTNSISSVQRKINPGLHIRGVLLTMTQHTKVSEHYAHDVRAKYGRTLHVFTTEIPYNVKVQESQAITESTGLKRKIAAVERRAGIENAKFLGKMLQGMTDSRIHTTGDYDKVIHNLGKTQIGLTNELAEVKQKRTTYAAAAKHLQICKTYKPVWMEYAAKPLNQKMEYFNQHSTELQAYRNAAAYLEKESIDQSVEIDKVNVLAQEMGHRMHELVEQLRDVNLQEQKVRQERQTLAEIRSDLVE